jgi:RimJ/RimL family protein N-acetyltransferase/predicted GNAT family acetyltransferase
MVDRIRDFRRTLAHAAAERSVETRHGFALLSESIPSVYDANYLSVEAAVAPAADLAAEADATMEACFHRRVVVEQGGVGLTDDFAELGYTLSTHLVLAHARDLDRRVDTSFVREVAFEDLVAARTAGMLAQPWADAALALQLDELKRMIAAAAPTRYVAAFVGGEVAGYCEVRSNGQVAQIEDVEVLERFRGRGLGRAIVQHALEDASRGHEIVFLEALADDWPRELYRKLGFDVVDRRDVYTKFPHPLTRLRLRTPRLELRIANVAELRALFRVAEAGIHDPAEMPFGVAWTDDLQEAAFVAHHVHGLAQSRPEDWNVILAAFRDGEPVGAQSVRGRKFGERRTVDTGSWLGRPHQGQGLGTEMRAAVLALAFDELGAERATSGAIQRNPQSLGVSTKLGYVETGSHLVSPRGEPVEHVDLELAADRFQAPVPVEITGLDDLLPFFGAA